MRTALNRTQSILPSLGSASSLSVTFSTETRSVPGYSLYHLGTAVGHFPACGLLGAELQQLR